MATVHVFGDTGGHGLQLFAALEEIGVDLESATIPPGVLIVHLGDLVHRGPLSNEIVAKVDELIRNNPGQWLQLIGNHETQHLQGGLFFWDACLCSKETVAILRRWHEEDLARIAWAIEDVLPQRWNPGNRPIGQDTLVSSFLATHGGLTLPVWANIGRLQSATEVAEILVENTDWSFRSVGHAMGIERLGLVGPVWARAAAETFHYWEQEHRIEGVTMPFGQLVGHSAPYDFAQRRWWANTPEELRRNSKVLVAERRTVAFVADSVLVCMDPGYGVNLSRLSDPKQPYLTFETREGI